MQFGGFSFLISDSTNPALKGAAVRESKTTGTQYYLEMVKKVFQAVLGFRVASEEAKALDGCHASFVTPSNPSGNIWKHVTTEAKQGTLLGKPLSEYYVRCDGSETTKPKTIGQGTNRTPVYDSTGKQLTQTWTNYDWAPVPKS